MSTMKGIVKGYQNFGKEIVIDISKKEHYRRDPKTGQSVGVVLIENKEFPRINSVVRIIFRERDKK